MNKRIDFPITVLDFDEAARVFSERLLEEGAWADLHPTNVGSFIRRMVAGTYVAHQQSIMNAARQPFYHTANRDSSIYAIVRSQGIKIPRKTSAAVVVRLHNNSGSARVVAPYSEHRIGNVIAYNKQQYVISSGATVEVTLTQGEVKRKDFDLDLIPTAYREFLLGEPGFSVTSDLYVYVRDKATGTVYAYAEADSALYEYGGEDRVYFETTTATGDVSFIFGDGEYGAALPKNAILSVRYVLTNGQLSNGIMPGAKVTYSALPTISGETVETSAGGAEQKTAAHYKHVGSRLARAQTRAISPSDIRSRIIDYPGVADCAVLGQRDIAPDDKTWMNTVRICVLPLASDSWGGANPNPKSGAWQNFLDYITPFLHDRLEIQTWNPVKVFVSVNVSIAVHEWAADRIDEVRTQINENILRLFRKRAGVLKRRVTKSDIEKACRVDGVDYIEVLSPEENSV